MQNMKGAKHKGNLKQCTVSIEKPENLNFQYKNHCIDFIGIDWKHEISVRAEQNVMSNDLACAVHIFGGHGHGKNS